MAYADKAKRSANQKKRCRRNRAELIQLLGGKCAVCGITDNLQFHHLDPNRKSFTIGASIRGTRAQRLAEVKKCELRCEDHHKETHAAPHGTESRFRSGCRCDGCIDGKRAYNRAWMAKWRADGKDKSRAARQGARMPCKQPLPEAASGRSTNIPT